MNESVNGQGVATDKIVTLGAVDVASRNFEKGSITVASPERLEHSDLDKTVSVLSHARNQSTAGEFDENISGFVVEEVYDYGGLAIYDDGFVINPSSTKLDHDSTWVHEYYHNLDYFTQSGSTGGEMTWYTEGYAEYKSQSTTAQMGLGSYADVEEYVTGSHDATRLSEVSDGSASVNYNKGGAVLYKTDYRIRQATDGEHTLDTVIERIANNDSEITLEEFNATVAAVANESVAERTHRLITTEANATMWSESAHEEVFGPILSTEVEKTAYRRMGDDRVEIDLTEFPTLYVNQSIEVEYTIENQRPSATEETINTYLSDQNSPTDPFYNNTTTVEASPNETTTVNHTYRFESTRSFYNGTTDAGGHVETPGPVNGTVPADIDGDGRYEDFNRNGKLDHDDVSIFYQNYDHEDILNDAGAYDFNGDGEINMQDVMALQNAV